VIQSVGVDIGTTTTQLVFSALQLQNLGGVTQTPRYAITSREILYKSPVVFTPKSSWGTLDADSLRALIDGWYAQAGKKVSDVETGAVIITGESLKASNAREIVMDMVSGLGDFVVATAGPHLESILAGRGAGVAARSMLHLGRHINLDIGGGTSNFAVFERDKVVATACLNVGGRLVELTESGKVKHIHTPALRIVEDVLPGYSESSITPQHIAAVADRMAELICQVLSGHPDKLCMSLLQTAPLPFSQYASVSVSGGVGACMVEASGSPYRFGDMGPLLAEALYRRLKAAKVNLIESEQTVRATVIGAGAWSLTLSGSTVWAHQDVLPLRNIPVAAVDIDWDIFSVIPQPALENAVSRLDLNEGELFIFAFGRVPEVTYRTVQLLTDALVIFYRNHPQQQTILVSVEDDMGKALGMALHAYIQKPIVVIDEVNLREGDYVDLASSLQGGSVVPLTIKSLVFPTDTTLKEKKADYA